MSAKNRKTDTYTEVSCETRKEQKHIAKKINYVCYDHKKEAEASSFGFSFVRHFQSTIPVH